MLNQTEHKLFTDLLDRFGEKSVLERELGLWNLPWKKKKHLIPWIIHPFFQFYALLFCISQLIK